MAELVDALVSEASGETRGSSNLLGRTKRNFKNNKNEKDLTSNNNAFILKLFDWLQI